MTQILFTKVGLNTWIVPSDWNNSNNSFEAIGGGSGGVTMPTGGGGGAYARSNNIILIPGQTVWVWVGAGGVTPPATLTGVAGQASWINSVNNSQPTGGMAAIAVCAGGGGVGSNPNPYTVGTLAPGGVGICGQFTASGGSGSTVDILEGGSGGGAGGPHGAGQNGYVTGGNYVRGGIAYGGAGDAGYGGAGGISTVGYSSLNNGQNGPNNGSGGGGGHDATGYLPSIRVGLGFGGAGGLYGGGGGSSVGGSIGTQGICKITYIPYIAPANTPALPPPFLPSMPVTPPPPCVPSGFDTATPAEVFWAYGAFTDPWNNVSAAHYDTNYNHLEQIVSDNDDVSFDISYNDTLPWNFRNEQENFYIDYPRVWKSRSNEWIDDGGTHSIWMRHRTILDNSDCVPNVDPPSGYVTLLQNQLFMDEQTYGYRLSYSNNIGYFNPGDIVTQAIDGNTNISGYVYMMDPYFIYVNIPVGGFFADFTVMNAFNPSINAYVTAVTEMNEKYSANVFPGQSRYICKSTLLASGQDAEDLQVFMTAHRPANSNFKVYGKVISGADSGQYNNQIWSRLIESNNTVSSHSSLTNSQDYVNVEYSLPVSQLLLSNMQSSSCNTTSLFVTVSTVSQFTAGDYIYLSSPGQGTFNVRQIINIPNNSTLAISALPSFSNTSNLNVGVIPGLEDPTAAFLYDQNSNIVRYVTNADVSFDLFNQFAVKIVPISDNPVVCPTITEFRAVALQASS